MPGFVMGSLFFVGLMAAMMLFFHLQQRAKARREPIGPKVTFETVRREMEARAAPTLLLVPTGEAVFSKLGGAPDLDDRTVWPTSPIHYSRRKIVQEPLDFVGQIDLAELGDSSPAWLPREGRLHFFYGGGVGAVLHDAPFDPERPAVAAPETLEGLLAERRVTTKPATSYPDVEWLVGDLRRLDVDETEMEELSKPPGLEMPIPEHRIGGYASPIQGSEMELECEQDRAGREGRIPTATRARDTDWRLLLQVDSDDDLGMNWVDSGRLYYWIREQDARAGDFSKVHLTAQFY